MNRSNAIVCCLAMLLATTSVVCAQTYQTSDGHAPVVRVEGDSTLHAWHAESRDVAAELKATLPLSAWAESAPGTALGTIEAAVRAESLKSGKDGLDDNMYKALKTGRYPELKAIINVVTTDEGPVGRAALFACDRQVDTTFPLDVTSVEEEANRWILSGEIPLLMSNFGIKPPKAMLGMIKAADAITVGFSWSVTLQDDDGEAP